MRDKPGNQNTKDNSDLLLMRKPFRGVFRAVWLYARAGA